MSAAGRLLSDAAVCELAVASDKAPITNRKHLEKTLKPLGSASALKLEHSPEWISAIITQAVALPNQNGQ
jgi:ribonuclease D